MPSPPVRSRSLGRPPSRPRPGSTRTRRHREVRVFTLTCPVSRPAHNHGARHPGRDGRSPLLLAAALAVAVPGFLVTACSGQPGSGAAGSDAVAAANSAVTGGPATGVPATEARAPSTSRRPSAVRAVKLLAQAAQAAIVTSY